MRTTGSTVQAEWVAGQRDGLVAVMRRDGARRERATVADVGDGVVRVRFLELRGGRWVRLADATLDLDALCVIEPIDPDDVPAALLLLEAA